MNSIPAADSARAHAATERTVVDAAGKTRPRLDRRVASIALVLAFAAAGAVATAAHAQSPVPGWLPCEYTLTVIEPPDVVGGPETLEFNDINDDFVAVGLVGVGLGNLPCLWSEAQGVVILPSPPGFSGGTARRINNNGWILVWAGGGPVRSFVYIPQGDGTYGIVPLPPQAANGSIYAMDINDHDEVVGRFQFLPRGSTTLRWAGFRWSPNGEGLQWYQVPGWSATECHGINNAGVIVGAVGPSDHASAGTTGVRVFVDEGGEISIVEPELPWVQSHSPIISESGQAACIVWKPPADGASGLSNPAIVEPGASTPTVIPPPVGWVRWGIGLRLRANGMAGAWVTNDNLNYKPAIFVDEQVVLLSEVVDSPFSLVTGVRPLGVDGTAFVRFNGKVLMFRPTLGVPDLNCDGVVDANDLAVLLDQWNTAAVAADLNGDGIVDAADLGILLNAWSPR